MQSRGRLKDASRLYSGKYLITFEIDAEPDLNEMTDDLDITAKAHREKRSINANAYFHVLAGKIAEKAGTSITHEKNRLLRSYGQWEYIDGKIPTFTVKAEYEDQALDMDGTHFGVAHRSADTVTLGLMRGSHTFNTKEMSRLIDGTIEEAKELGIETSTPEQIRRMMAAWDSNHDARKPAT